MTINKKIYINDTKHSDFNEYLVQRLSHYINMHDISADVNCGDINSLSLDEGQYSVFFIDSASVTSLVSNGKAKELISVNKNRINQIILVLFGIEADKLPDFLQKCTIFNYPLTESDGSAEQIQLNVYNDRIQVNNSIFDVLQSIFPKLNTSSDILKVFVGPYNGNARQEYHKVMRELRHRGFDIVDYNTIKSKLINEESLFNELKDINTSIHFLSHDSLQNYPHTLSVPVIVNKQASDFCKTGINKRIKRIIYIPPVMPDTSDEIVRNIDLFKRDAESLINAEIIQSPIERLKGIILEYLLNSNNSNKYDIENKDKMVYFIFPFNNRNEAMQIVENMKDNNINVCYPDFNLNRLELLEYHQNCLKNCTGVLIYNSNNTKWLTRKFNDVMKAPGWGRKDSISHKYICGKELDKEVDIKLNGTSYKYINSTNDKGFVDIFQYS